MIQIACSKHPKYRACREPRVDCEACRLLWAIVTRNLCRGIKVVDKVE